MNSKSHLFDTLSRRDIYRGVCVESPLEGLFVEGLLEIQADLTPSIVYIHEGIKTVFEVDPKTVVKRFPESFTDSRIFQDDVPLYNIGSVVLFFHLYEYDSINIENEDYIVLYDNNNWCLKPLVRYVKEKELYSKNLIFSIEPELTALSTEYPCKQLSKNTFFTTPGFHKDYVFLFGNCFDKKALNTVTHRCATNYSLI